VLHISELVRVARTVDGAGSSPLASRVGRPWGCERVRFVRSSATHVFVCDPPAFLRFAPAALEDVAGIAELSVRIAASGGPVAPARPSRDGALAVEVDGYVGSAFEAVDGEQLEADALSLEQARSWGRALATVHDIATRLQPPPRVRRWLDRVRAAAEAVGHADIDVLSRLPTDSAAFGIVHGDPELDNVIWAPDPVFVDLDDAAWSWFAADIAFALRDFAPPARAPDTASEPVASFVAGYREIRDVELEHLPLFARAHALVTLARLQRTLDEPVDQAWPDWAAMLRRRVEGVAARLRTALAA
jgi:Ser/Thr protein kinase RdoA (MazF antagonist)